MLLTSYTHVHNRLKTVNKFHIDLLFSHTRFTFGKHTHTLQTDTHPAEVNSSSVQDYVLSKHHSALRLGIAKQEMPRLKLAAVRGAAKADLSSLCASLGIRGFTCLRFTFISPGGWIQTNKSRQRGTKVGRGVCIYFQRQTVNTAALFSISECKLFYSEPRLERFPESCVCVSILALCSCVSAVITLTSVRSLMDYNKVKSLTDSAHCQYVRLTITPYSKTSTFFAY